MATVSTCYQVAGTSGTTNKHADGVVFLEPATMSLPTNVQEHLAELEHQFKEGDLTEKGYHKRRSQLLMPYLIPYHDPKNGIEKDDETVIEPDLELLPKPVLEELKKLQEELENEEITEKGFNKRRSLILAPYMLKEPPRNELPANILQEYTTLESEYKEGDLTDKGFRKKKIKLLRPYLVAVNPSTYSNLKQKVTTPLEGAAKAKIGEKGVVGIQSVANDGKKLFECGVCGEVFDHAHSFSGHCRLHRGERVKDFKCSICNAAYSTKSHLKFHMYKHTGNYPFSCRYCGKGFAGRSQHKSHESRHTGESSYPCTQCGAKFWKKDKFDVHVQTCLQSPTVTSVQPEERPLPGGSTRLPWSSTNTEQNNSGHVESGKIAWTHPTNEQTNDNNYKSDNTQNCTQTFDTGGEMHTGGIHTGEIHMQDLSNINMTTINLADVSASPVQTVTNTRENVLTTPTLGVVSSMDSKNDIALSNVRLNIDPRIGKLKTGTTTYTGIS